MDTASAGSLTFLLGSCSSPAMSISSSMKYACNNSREHVFNTQKVRGFSSWTATAQPQETGPLEQLPIGTPRQPQGWRRHQAIMPTRELFYLVEIEDEVQFADITKVAVQDFYIVVDDLQCDQLIVAHVNSHHKVQTCVSLIHHLCQQRLSIKQGGS